MTSLYMKYLYKISQGCDSAIMALQVVKKAPDKAFEEDIDARIQAAESIIRNIQEVKRYLLYFKNKQRGAGKDIL